MGTRMGGSPGGTVSLNGGPFWGRSGVELGGNDPFSPPGPLFSPVARKRHLPPSPPFSPSTSANTRRSGLMVCLDSGNCGFGGALTHAEFDQCGDCIRPGLLDILRCRTPPAGVDGLASLGDEFHPLVTRQ